MSTRLMLFYTKEVRELRSLYAYVDIFVSFFLKNFLHAVICLLCLYNTNDLHTVVYFQGFPSNTNDYIISSYYSCE